MPLWSSWGDGLTCRGAQGWMRGAEELQGLPKTPSGVQGREEKPRCVVLCCFTLLLSHILPHIFLDFLSISQGHISDLLSSVDNTLIFVQISFNPFSELIVPKCASFYLILCSLKLCFLFFVGNVKCIGSCTMPPQKIIYALPQRS